MLIRISSAITVLLLLGACGSGEPPPGTADAPSGVASPATPDSPGHIVLTSAQQRGRELYDLVCWTCHGISGRGDGPAVQAGSIEPPPNLLDSPYAEMTPDEIVRLFAAVIGQQDDEHPHMRNVSSVIKPEEFREALRFVPALAHPTKLPGSAVAGERLYQVRCQGCHGANGRGDGPWAGQLAVLPPADFTQDTLLASENYDAAFARIREGGAVHASSMPPWGVVLSDDEIWDVLAYISLFHEGGSD